MSPLRPFMVDVVLCGLIAPDELTASETPKIKNIIQISMCYAYCVIILYICCVSPPAGSSAPGALRPDPCQISHEVRSGEHKLPSIDGVNWRNRFISAIILVQTRIKEKYQQNRTTILKVKCTSRCNYLLGDRRR